MSLNSVLNFKILRAEFKLNIGQYSVLLKRCMFGNLRKVVMGVLKVISIRGADE